MDYEKKYKEALARAREIHVSKDELEYLFPELKESEDEKIRKDLIWAINKDWFMNGNTIKDSKFTKKDILAWLDRQSNNYSHLIELKAKAYDDAKDRMSYAYNQNRVSISFMNEIFPNIKLYENQSNKPKGKTALEAINEEKIDNANKVKSPFHEGDWIVSNNTKIVFLVKYYSFYLNSYTFEDTNGYIYSHCIPPTEKDYHLWNIKDAKDGDVLQLGKVTAIFQNYISDKECRCYCSVFEGEFRIPIHYNDIYGCHNAIPATKEQRDTLMKAMTDAGYTFDFEKKELKKVKNEIEIPFGAKDSELQEDTYYIPKGFHANIDKDKVVIKKGGKSINDNIWHDNKCIPDKDDKEILVEYNLNNSTRPNHLFHDVAPYDSDCKMFHCYSMHLKLEEIIRWAYMDDILQVVNR